MSIQLSVRVLLDACTDATFTLILVYPRYIGKVKCLFFTKMRISTDFTWDVKLFVQFKNELNFSVRGVNFESQ